MKINELDFDYWELAEVREDTLFSLSKKNELTLIWTPLHINGKGVDAYILNVLSPENTCFWDFCTYYTAFYHGENTCTSDFSSRDSSVRVIKKFISTACLEKNKFFSHVLLDGVLRFLGNSLGSGFGYWYHRRFSISHDSMYVPTEIRPYVHDYFLKQLDQFGDTAFAACDRDALAGVDFELALEEPWAKKFKFIFHSVIHKLTGLERKNLIEQIEAQPDTEETLSKPMMYMLNLKYVGTTYLPWGSSKEFIDDFSKILNYRVDWAVKNTPLKSLELSKTNINDPLWGGVDISSLRNELRKKIDTKLCQYPIIQTNPFETYKSREKLIF